MWMWWVVVLRDERRGGASGGGLPIWWWLDAWLGCSQWGTYLFFGVHYVQVYMDMT